MLSLIDDDDDLQLSAHTLAALQSFMIEKEEQQRRFDELQEAAQREKDIADKRVITMADFEEDWQISQFWNDDETAQKLAKALAEGVKEGDVIACISSPSTFVMLRQMRQRGELPEGVTIRLFEYDRRFALFGDDYVFYDFNYPLKGVPAELKGKCTRVIADPPFLNEDTQTKTALTIRYLTPPWSPSSSQIMLCTGERMRELIIDRLYKPAGMKMTTFEVGHRNGLNNEFCCYSTWESDILKWGEPEKGKAIEKPIPGLE